MTNKYSDMSEEELVEELDRGIESDEQLAELLAAMQEKGLSGGLIGFSGDDKLAETASIEYINFHDQVKSNKVPEKEIKEAIAILNNPKADTSIIKKAIITLAHTGELKPLRALEKYSKIAKDELAVWAQIAVDECKMFLESKLSNKPTIKIKKISGAKK